MLRKTSAGYEPVGSAVEIPEARLPTVSSSVGTPLVPIKIMQLGKDTISVHVNLGWSVSEMKQRVFSEDVSAGKNIRIIHFGKMLNDIDILSEAGVKENAFLHVSITDRVAAVASPVNAAGEGDLNNSELENAAAFEEMKQFNEEDFVVRSEGTRGDFALGFAMGFVIGIIMLIWVWQPRIPRKQKLGIIAGICFNMLMSSMDKSSHTKNTPASTPAPDQSINTPVGN